jgi:hypothetical protein
MPEGNEDGSIKNTSRGISELHARLCLGIMTACVFAIALILLAWISFFAVPDLNRTARGTLVNKSISVYVPLLALMVAFFLKELRRGEDRTTHKGFFCFTLIILVPYILVPIVLLFVIGKKWQPVNILNVMDNFKPYVDSVLLVVLTFYFARSD